MRARASEARGRWFDSSRPLQILKIRGLGKRFNPLGLGPRESRFESEVPDQFLWGSQAVRQLAVNQFIRRFESCPHSQNAGGAFCPRCFKMESLCPTNRRSRVRSSTPVPEFRSDCAPVAEWIQASLFSPPLAHNGAPPCAPERYTLVRIQPGVPSRGRSMAGRRSLKPSTLVRFQPSAPNSCWRGVRCTGGLINRFAPDRSTDWVQLPAPAPSVRSS
jgi:hypothetical protein